jgi:hypothetical protein
MAKGLPRSLEDLYARVEALESAIGGTVAAADVTYDNTVSELEATNVKAAIDELKGLIDGMA